MKKITKLLLGILFAIVLVCGTTAVDSLTDQPMNEVQAKAKISLSKKKVSLYVKKTTTLKLKGTKKKAKWSTSNKKVATVNAKGKR